MLLLAVLVVAVVVVLVAAVTAVALAAAAASSFRVAASVVPSEKECTYFSSELKRLCREVHIIT
jgi:hypothetical protein